MSAYSEMPAPKPGDWPTRISRPMVPCPGGCGEMIEDGLTHRPWACAAARAGHLGQVAQAVGGVMWCPVHHGIADEIAHGGDTCDQWSHGQEGCSLRELFFFGDPS